MRKYQQNSVNLMSVNFGILRVSGLNNSITIYQNIKLSYLQQNKLIVELYIIMFCRNTSLDIFNLNGVLL